MKQLGTTKYAIHLLQVDIHYSQSLTSKNFFDI